MQRHTGLKYHNCFAQDSVQCRIYRFIKFAYLVNITSFQCGSESFECLRFGNAVTLEDSPFVVTSGYACSLSTAGLGTSQGSCRDTRFDWLAGYLDYGFR